MKGPRVSLALLVAAISACSSVVPDPASKCYYDPLPSVSPSEENGTIPWGSPSIINGSQTCCTSLDEVRAGINAVDNKLLELLAQR